MATSKFGEHKFEEEYVGFDSILHNGEKNSFSSGDKSADSGVLNTSGLSENIYEIPEPRPQFVRDRNGRLHDVSPKGACNCCTEKTLGHQEMCTQFGHSHNLPERYAGSVHQASCTHEPETRFRNRRSEFGIERSNNSSVCLGCSNYQAQQCIPDTRMQHSNSHHLRCLATEQKTPLNVHDLDSHVVQRSGLNRDSTPACTASSDPRCAHRKNFAEASLIPIKERYLFEQQDSYHDRKGELLSTHNTSVYSLRPWRSMETLNQKPEPIYDSPYNEKDSFNNSPERKVIRSAQGRVDTTCHCNLSQGSDDVFENDSNSNSSKCEFNLKTCREGACINHLSHSGIKCNVHTDASVTHRTCGKCGILTPVNSRFHDSAQLNNSVFSNVSCKSKNSKNETPVYCSHRLSDVSGLSKRKDSSRFGSNLDKRAKPDGCNLSETYVTYGATGQCHSESCSCGKPANIRAKLSFGSSGSQDYSHNEFESVHSNADPRQHNYPGSDLNDAFIQPLDMLNTPAICNALRLRTGNKLSNQTNPLRHSYGNELDSPKMPKKSYLKDHNLLAKHDLAIPLLPDRLIVKHPKHARRTICSGENENLYNQTNKKCDIDSVQPVYAHTYNVNKLKEEAAIKEQDGHEYQNQSNSYYENTKFDYETHFDDYDEDDDDDDDPPPLPPPRCPRHQQIEIQSEKQSKDKKKSKSKASQHRKHDKENVPDQVYANAACREQKSGKGGWAKIFRSSFRRKNRQQATVQKPDGKVKSLLHSIAGSFGRKKGINRTSHHDDNLSVDSDVYWSRMKRVVDVDDQPPPRPPRLNRDSSAPRRPRRHSLPTHVNFKVDLNNPECLAMFSSFIANNSQVVPNTSFVQEPKKLEIPKVRMSAEEPVMQRPERPPRQGHIRHNSLPERAKFGININANSENVQAILASITEKKQALKQPAPLPEENSESDSKAEMNKPSAFEQSSMRVDVKLEKTINFSKYLSNKPVSHIAVFEKGEVLLTDRHRACVLNQDGTLRRIIGSREPGLLTEPKAASVLANGDIVLCDHATQDLKIFSSKGVFIRCIESSLICNTVSGIATTDQHEIIVVGFEPNAIIIYTSSGRHLATFPKEELSGYLDHPYSVAVNRVTNEIIVGDDGKHEVTSWSKQGQLKWRYTRAGRHHFFPSSICVDNHGYVFIADLYNENIYMLDCTGKYLQTVLSRKTGLKGNPTAISVDDKGLLYIADEEKVLKIFR